MKVDNRSNLAKQIHRYPKKKKKYSCCRDIYFRQCCISLGPICQHTLLTLVRKQPKNYAFFPAKHHFLSMQYSIQLCFPALCLLTINQYGVFLVTLCCFYLWLTPRKHVLKIPFLCLAACLANFILFSLILDVTLGRFPYSSLFVTRSFRDTPSTVAICAINHLIYSAAFIMIYVLKPYILRLSTADMNNHSFTSFFRLDFHILLEIVLDILYSQAFLSALNIRFWVIYPGT